MRRFLIAVAALVAALAIVAAVSLPPARRVLPAGPEDGTIPGILHVHTTRSDGRGTPDEIAAAAARTGLKFVVFTDHGDGTRAPDPPEYRSGVLCIDGVEISTNGGHYIAVGMRQAPYPLGGDARDVVEDVRRLGGFGIVAHPNSPKPELAWQDWSQPVDAIETINPDTTWRIRTARGGWRSKLRLADALLTYPIRPAETIGSLLSGTTAFDQWAAVAVRRRVVMIAGADAHSKLGGLRSADPGDTRWSLPFPSYDASFATMSIHVRVGQPLTGDARRDAAVLLRDMRAGHVYTAVDAAATPPRVAISATNEHGTVHDGDELALGGPLTLQVRTNAPADYTMTVRNGTRAVATRSPAAESTFDLGNEPGVYWVEIDRAGAMPAPWVATNPIYVRGTAALPDVPSGGTADAAASSVDLLFDGQSTAGWRIEQDDTSLGAVEVGDGVSGRELRFRYALSGGTPIGQYAALVVDRPSGIAGERRLALTMRTERPMRLSIQLRAPGDGGPQRRWQRSIYLDSFNQDRVLSLNDFTPVEPTTPREPDLAAVRSVLLVVDTTNTRPGASGRIWVKSAALSRY